MDNIENVNVEHVDSVDASKILDSKQETPAAAPAAASAEPKKSNNDSTMSMIFGIISIAGGFTGLISLGFAIAGLVYASKAKKAGCTDNMYMVGLATSILGIVVAASALLVIGFIVLSFGFSFVATIIAGFFGMILRSASSAAGLLF